MDVVLEVFDTYVCDYLYAKAFPISQPIQTPLLAKIANGLNATEAAASAAATAVSAAAAQAGGQMLDGSELLPASNAFVYRPSTELFTLEPSKWAYLSVFPRDNAFRQTLTLFMITWIFGVVLYFVFASLSYLFIFDHNTFHHPKFLKHQVRQEIMQTMRAMPLMSALTVPFFLGEVRGHSKIYDRLDEAPFPLYNLLQFPLFIAFTDMCIYWIHRWLHLPAVYKRLHKPHHKWIMPSPYASHAFHPVDGWAQSVPYHIFPFLFPLQKFANIFFFVFINFWTILIHDGEYVATSPVVNGAACHTMHHLFFRVNYGQFTTIWDRLGGSYRKPADEMFQKELKMCSATWKKQTQEMEKLVHEVEGDDDREYEGDAATETKKTM
ncbi:c-5 sterol desaturase [Ascosphaera acerosa]|nr:c-5 sterol desaturase [Ascosphaera acerosa]